MARGVGSCTWRGDAGVLGSAPGTVTRVCGCNSCPTMAVMLWVMLSKSWETSSCSSSEPRSSLGVSGSDASSSESVKTTTLLFLYIQRCHAFNQPTDLPRYCPVRPVYSRFKTLSMLGKDSL